MPVGGAPCAVQSMLNLRFRKWKNLSASNGWRRQAATSSVLLFRTDRSRLFRAHLCTLRASRGGGYPFPAPILPSRARRGAAKLRINLGNISGLKATIPVLEAAKEAGIPIRIGERRFLMRTCATMQRFRSLQKRARSARIRRILRGTRLHRSGGLCQGT